jgi:hypothetical protein
MSAKSPKPESKFCPSTSASPAKGYSLMQYHSKYFTLTSCGVFVFLCYNLYVTQHVDILVSKKQSDSIGSSTQGRILCFSVLGILVWRLHFANPGSHFSMERGTNRTLKCFPHNHFHWLRLLGSFSTTTTELNFVSGYSYFISI